MIAAMLAEHARSKNLMKQFAVSVAEAVTA
jgi:hypothetical protein